MNANKFYGIRFNGGPLDGQLFLIPEFDLEWTVAEAPPIDNGMQGGDVPLLKFHRYKRDSGGTTPFKYVGLDPTGSVP